MTRDVRQSGFALLMALVLVLMAGVALAATARRSMVDALDAKSAVEELQRRWAVESLRAALLTRVGNVLDEAETGESKDQTGEPQQPAMVEPVAELRLSCHLAGRDYLLILTDEQAKLNVNRLLRQSNRAVAQSALARFLSEQFDGQREGADIKLRPAAIGATATTDKQLAIGGFGQVFDQVSPALLAGDQTRPGLASMITCWGEGKVNLRRATPAVVRQACDRQVAAAAIDALLSARQRDPRRPLASILDDLKSVSHDERAKLRDLLTDESACHGLWIVARGRQRSWYTLAVAVTARPVAPSNLKSSGREVVERYDFAW